MFVHRWSRGFASNAMKIPTTHLKQHKKLMTPDKFKNLANAFFDKVELAITPLHPPMNQVFRVERTKTPAKLTIQTETHSFELVVLTKVQKIEFTSPISGTRLYVYNSKSLRWEDEVDSHDVEGLFTRDLMRMCSGLPQF
ncbi:hypothetical protein THRCLA_22043 [Thraustotheca clavata]|uniref:Uncharacterized protein n=1 Tax=Thraustotheca clavata TaxID=74557 RepID=A0A1V9ZD83_9STRA|nr:hypothetical protein THRCLA_22043 [Thraustotheca clavata]